MLILHLKTNRLGQKTTEIVEKVTWYLIGALVVLCIISTKSISTGSGNISELLKHKNYNKKMNRRIDSSKIEFIRASLSQRWLFYAILTLKKVILTPRDQMAHKMLSPFQNN